MRKSSLLVLLAMLVGCASLSEEECLSADWRAIGFEDGAKGEPLSAASERRDACAKRGAAALDMPAYLAGRREGLQAYCTPENGFAAGAGGAVDNRVCEGDGAERFLAGYSKGRRLFDLEASVIRANQALSDEQSDLWETRRRIGEVENAISSTHTPGEERADLVMDLGVLKEDRRRIEAAIAELAQDKARAGDDLAAFRAALMADGGATGALRPSNASY